MDIIGILSIASLALEIIITVSAIVYYFYIMYENKHQKEEFHDHIKLSLDKYDIEKVTHKSVS